jgi:iron(III) transport system substrate-binding protein
MATVSFSGDRGSTTGEGYLVMPNPGKSGIGYALVSGWIQIYGEEDAWKFMDDLHLNIREYTDSGRTPCNLVADGVYPLGLSFVSAATDKRKAGSSVVALMPMEGAGWDVEALAKVLKPDAKEIVDDFLDWSISNEAVYIDAQFFPLTSVKLTDPPPLPPGYPPKVSDYLIPQNFSWRTANYQRITNEWLKRYRDQSGSSTPQLELLQPKN